MTKRIVEAGAVLGIPLVDHVILAPSGRYSSLLDLGVIGAIGAPGATR
jgi:DNA repair protein RadC